MDKLRCFVAVEYPDDPNVAGNIYWYLCEDEGVAVGDGVVAPLGRHNRLQQGVVRRREMRLGRDAPYPLAGIKIINRVIKIKE